MALNLTSIHDEDALQLFEKKLKKLTIFFYKIKDGWIWEFRPPVPLH